jgi:hypothetical protein
MSNFFGVYEFHETYVADKFRNALILREYEAVLTPNTPPVEVADVLILLNGVNDTHLGKHFLLQNQVPVGEGYGHVLPIEFDADVTELVEDIAQNRENVSLLESRISTLETLLTTLESRLNALATP